MRTHLDGLARDIRHALRNLRKDRRFSLIAICALALGIGGSTVVFSVVYNMFFHTLPYKDFNRSVVFEICYASNAGGSKGRASFSSEEFRAFREQNHVFEEMIAHGAVGRLLYEDGKSTRVLPTGATVTTNTFNYLGMPPPPQTRPPLLPSLAVVVSAGLSACLLPARRAAQTDPLVALRYE